jgi:preprotein translocase subunit SecE
MTDKIKLAAAAVLLGIGIWGYYWLAESWLIVRIGAVLGGIAAGAAVALWSQPGREFATFAGESVEEVKKVVWPTRKDTTQTTLAVFAFVVVMAVFLWLTDKTLEWLLYDLTLGWRK